MILILSCNSFELSTENVIDWLVYNKKDYIRVNGNETIDTVNYLDLKTLFKDIPLDRINICWLRRWYEDNISELMNSSFISNTNSIILHNYLLKERTAISK